MKKNIDFKVEIILGSIGLLITSMLPKIGISNDVVWLIAVMVVILPIIMSSFKIFLNTALNRAIQEASVGTGLSNLLAYKISTLPESYIIFAREILAETIQKIDQIGLGIIPLRVEDYFYRLIEEARNLQAHDEVIAVNSFDERRFEHDPRENNYFEENIKAVKEREAKINRIFIYDDREINTSTGLEKLRAIKKNEDSGINVSIVKKSKMINQNDLLFDWVMFNCTKARLYVDYQDIVDETRVCYAEIRLNESDIEKFRNNYKRLLNHSISQNEKLELYKMLKENI